MQQLVLAIEPDTRQAAIVKRIVREKVLADVTVVDSRDAALEAMRRSVPDVLLLSALLSPRDEDELIAHLRTLEHAEHLQTHTIPQLSSSIGDDDEDRPKGLLSRWRRKGNGKAQTAGCDPDLFADEIRTYLKRASDKKREVNDGTHVKPIVIAKPAAGAQPREEEAAPETAASSWESPFEWRPSGKPARSASQAAAPPPAPVAATPAHDPAPPVDAPAAAAAVDPWSPWAPSEPIVLDTPTGGPESVILHAGAPAGEAKPFAAMEPIGAVEPDAIVEPLVAVEPDTMMEPVALVEPIEAAEPVAAMEPAAVMEPLIVPAPVVHVAPRPRAKLPLVKRRAREWWYEESDRPARDSGSELQEVLNSLSVPFHVAAMTYADGCRIRRVRTAAP